MKAAEIRKQFLDFFEKKQHKIVPSAAIVNKNDPTLMFINSGMAQFKDYFLGNQDPISPRITDTQKCLRVSGKHNDLEEVGIDSYHHTLFEMLGNWSFGDYFKEEAIAWAWELLTDVFKIDKDRLYVTVFGGDEGDKVPKDMEAENLWKQWINADRILDGDKKDNFWEMGATGPCGPCSEIHIDIRSDEERAAVDGKTLVNQDHPQVIEIWNLVFMQFNRMADGSLQPLPKCHVDTGMGFERLCMVLQGKTSNYDTDVFMPLIRLIEAESNVKYGFSYARSAKQDIAIRVVADHIRAISFTIADGQRPDNTGAGYVIRRILRRAVRYYYSYLDVQQPLLYKLVPHLAETFKDVFPELKAQEAHVTKTILSEEKAFLRTIGNGIQRLNALIAAQPQNGTLAGNDVFELYDTFGFPFDLTYLIAQENNLSVDEAGFKTALKAQKERSRKDANKEVGDWTILLENPTVDFVGYDHLQSTAKVVKYRTVKIKKKDQFQVVLNRTPFYPEGGGQVGDTGLLWFGEEKIPVLDTQKENELIIHVVKKLPQNIECEVRAEVNAGRRKLIINNHSATHLMHAALREVLGDHVQQRGSLNNDQYLRFDFSHSEAVTPEQIVAIENIVNARIRENIPLREQRDLPIDTARAEGAMMLFGEKYGETVRVITFGESFSKELCGGCHVAATGQIGFFKIVQETSVAAGIRRIEALTADRAEQHIQNELSTLHEVRQAFKNPKQLLKAIEKVQEDNKQLQKQVEKMYLMQAQIAKQTLIDNMQTIDGVQFITGRVDIGSADAIKHLAHELREQFEQLVLVLGSEQKGKAQLTVALHQNSIERLGLHAGKMVKTLAKAIRGGGGGQPFFATAGGKNPDGLQEALTQARTLVDEALQNA